MTAHVLTDKQRVIASKKNAWNSVDKALHKRTKSVPESFFKALSVEDETIAKESAKKLLKTLKKEVGTPDFYEDGFFLYQTDCVKFLEKIRDKSSVRFDLTLTSPPYNIGKEYETNKTVETFTEWCTEWMNLIHQTTTDTGSFWLNLGYFEVPSKGKCVPISYLLWDKTSFYLQQEVVWHYGAGVASKKRLSPRNEKWLWYTMQEDDYLFNLDEIRDPNVKYPNQKKNGKFRCNPLGKNPSDVWIFPKVTSGSKRSSKERTDHPAQFPLSVVERAMKASSNVGDIVYDPFSGSASTGVATYGLGRLYIGTELRSDYLDISIERYKNFKKLRTEVMEHNKQGGQCL